MIYLDNNATTTMPKCVMKAMLTWCNRGNASASYASAKESRAMMEDFRKYIGGICGIDTCCPEPRDSFASTDASVNTTVVAKCDPARYKVIFTSGASEANSAVINAAVAAYSQARDVIPNLVISAVEHKGLIATAESLRERGLATITYVQPVVTGHVLARDVAAAIGPTTCLVCVMHANNETGAINDVAAIGLAAHSRGVPFHCDTVQTFGKFPPQPVRDSIDSLCVSFHKLHGPSGIGAWIIKQKFLIGWKLPPMIFGSQNEGYRGGTENLPGIGASFTAMRYNFADRGAKNRRMYELKQQLIQGLAGILPVRTYAEYYADRPKPLECVLFSQAGPQDSDEDPEQYGPYEHYGPYLCNTVLLSVVWTRGEICNVKIKNYLESEGIVVSVGSACNTASAKASHVLYALTADKYIRKGALRISLGDDNTSADIEKFLIAFGKAVKAQI